MRTTDLIPLILIELNTADRYGLEIAKAVEEKTNGKVVIKQPTLYTILKKLEKSKFITSYWEDSEIGGKRHYYKITENGKQQVATMPSFNEILKQILSGDATKDEINHSTEPENAPQVDIPFTPQFDAVKPEIKAEQKQPFDNSFSIMDALFADENPEPSEPEASVLPSQQVFEETESVDSLTEHELNKMNSNILKKDAKFQEETFASSSNVSKFTKEMPSNTNEEYKEDLNNLYNKTIEKELKPFKVRDEIDEIAFDEYVDFKKDKKYQYAKRMKKSIITKSILSSLYLLLVAIASIVISCHTSPTPLFYIYFTLSFVVALFYPTLTMLNAEKFRLKCEKTNYKHNKKLHLIFASICLIAVFVISIIYCLNIKIKFISIFGWNNFVNIYSPLFMALTAFIDLLFAKILYK